MPIPSVPPMLPGVIGEAADVLDIEAVTPPGSGALSYKNGWPALTALPLEAGGVAPQREYFNAVNKLLSQHVLYQQTGNLYPWDNGQDYSAHAILRGSDGRAYIALKPSGPATPDSDGAGVVGPIDPVGDTSGHWADVMAMLGGNLLYNDAALITESGTWEAPVTGWYWVWLISGGCGGLAGNGKSAWGASGVYSGFYMPVFMYMHAGETVPVTIGSGGIGGVIGVITLDEYSGKHTRFGDYATNENYLNSPDKPMSARFMSAPTYYQKGAFNQIFATGAGLGGGYSTYQPLNPNNLAGQSFHNESCDGGFWGGSGGAFVHENGFCCYGNGKQGAVIALFHNPAKAAGPAPTPALFMARAAARVATQPAVVNLYDPETGQGSVWLEEDEEAKLAEGLVSQEAWQEICQAKAAEERAAWLASPDTEAERFEMLRGARDARLSATDYLVAPDYPLTDEQRAAVTAYRQALRDLPAQEGVPWDGGGELTPWPSAPEISTSKESSHA